MSDPTTPDDEVFAAAFAELQVPGAAPAPAATPPVESAPAADTPAPAPAAPSGEASAAPGESSAATPTGDAAAAPPADTAAATTPTAAPPAAAPSEPAVDYAAQLAALQAELAEVKKAQPAPAPAPAEPPRPLYTPEDQAAVDAYLKEWPDVAKGEALMRRAEYQQLVQYVMQQFAPRLDALESSQSTTSTRTQYQDLVTLVPDYDQVRDATLAWIEQQPAYLKAAYQQVAEHGTPQDVADLIGRFKKETNYAAAAPAAPAAPAAAPAAPVAAAKPVAPTSTALPPAAAAAAAALKPVKTARTEPSGAPDPNDFDAAFKEAVAAMS